MKKRSVANWLRNIPIARKLYFTVGIMALLIAIELMTLLFAINTLSAVRAYVGAEGLWSKAQKDAVYSLQKYGANHNENDYKNYLIYLKVNLGDRKARQELEKENPDLNVVRQGFVEGRVHPDDIDGAIKLVRRFHSISYLSEAMAVWKKGDAMISQLQVIATDLHDEISAANASKERISSILKQIDSLNDSLTKVEDDFSFTLGAGSRWLEDVVLGLLLGLVLTVEVCGLSLTIFVSRGITRGLGEIIKTAEAIAVGDMSIRAKAFSHDEIGKLAQSFNAMTDRLEQNITVLKEREEELHKAEVERKEVLMDLMRRNKDLEQFSYMVSHNLRSPIASIIGLSELLETMELSAAEEGELKNGLFSSVKKLDDVIKDLNYILQVKHDVTEHRQWVKFQDIVSDIRISLSTLMNSEEVTIYADFTAAESLLTIRSYLYSIVLNLISNSIKYRRGNVAPIIVITSHKHANGIELVLRDNGIGIDLDRSGADLFGLYKRFHFHTEGKGIGLYLVKTQATILGGKISVASEVNDWTEFRIMFDSRQLN